MPSLEELWERLCRRRGFFWGLILVPLSVLYGLISRFSRLGKAQRVAGLKVISVGNLSMGGSGKSPLVALLAGWHGRKKTAVLTRGYGSDEAAMLERALPHAKVLVNSDRLAAARQARVQGCEVAILDDGFQRRHQLERDLDILLLDWSRLDVERHCLPAGRLREPLSAAADADAVLVTHAPLDYNREALRACLPLAYQGLSVFRADHVPVALRSLSGAKKPLSWLKGRRVTAMSGIGRPEGFEAALEALGAQVTSLRFSDHHAYRERDIPGAGVVICTAKDAAKLASVPIQCQLWVLEIELRVSPEKEFKAMVLR